MDDFETVIGLEIHVELLTASKMFCGCAVAFGAEPNTQVCPVCLGMPGVLPVANRKAVELAMRTAAAFGGEIAPSCRFARKNYFYPDLPKNYQISQYEEPIARGGTLSVDDRTIRLTRVHLEEDAGKLIHQETGTSDSLVDINRTGIPLMEIVTEPDIRTPEEAARFLELLKQTLQYLAVSDCTMEEGSLRCDANISLRRKGETTLGVKTEVKNLNSFKSVRRALAHEELRQAALLRSDGNVKQETRLWNDDLGRTEKMRGKEEAHDYRYFPEPDLVPIVIDDAWREAVASSVGELPPSRRERFASQYGLPDYDIRVLTADRRTADYFERCVGFLPEPKAVANWMMGDLAALINETDSSFEDCPVRPEHLAELLGLVVNGKITQTAAKEILRELFTTPGSPLRMVRERNLLQMEDDAQLAAVVGEVLAANPQAVADYRLGKQQAAGFLVGQVMRRTKGTANPQKTGALIKETIDRQP